MAPRPKRLSTGMRRHIRLQKAGLRKTDSGRVTREPPKKIIPTPRDPERIKYGKEKFGKRTR